MCEKLFQMITLEQRAACVCSWWFGIESIVRLRWPVNKQNDQGRLPSIAYVQPVLMSRSASWSCCTIKRENDLWVMSIVYNLGIASLPVEVIEERQQVDGQLHPSFLLAVCEHVRVHDARGIIEARSGHNWAMHVPVWIIRVFASIAYMQSLTAVNRRHSTKWDFYLQFPRDDRDVPFYKDISPVHMISDEWHVDDERKPFAGAQKDDIHDNMKHILGKHQLRGKIIAFWSAFRAPARYYRLTAPHSHLPGSNCCTGRWDFCSRSSAHRRQSHGISRRKSTPHLRPTQLCTTQRQSWRPFWMAGSGRAAAIWGAIKRRRPCVSVQIYGLQIFLLSWLWVLENKTNTNNNDFGFCDFCVFVEVWWFISGEGKSRNGE